MPQGTNRADRVAGSLKREIGQLIQEEVKDPRIGLVSISHVDVSRDLSRASIYITSLDTAEATAESLDALHHARGYMRALLGKRLAMKRIPELLFRYDETVERGRELASLIERARRADEDKGSGSGRD